MSQLGTYLRSKVPLLGEANTFTEIQSFANGTNQLDIRADGSSVQPTANKAYICSTLNGSTVMVNAGTASGSVRLNGAAPAGADIRLGPSGTAFTNLLQGRATLVGGTVTVANANASTSSRIIVTSNVDGGTPGWLRVSAIVDATSFTITSSSGTDTSTVSWVMINVL